MKKIKTFFLLSLALILSSCESDDDSVLASQGKILAAQVKDKASLKAFVLSAKKHLERDYKKALSDFREKEEWKKGSIYLFGLTVEGVSLFHVAKPELEGQNLLDAKDPNGTEIVKELLNAAKTKSGGFVEYLWDNPAKEGEDASQKISYTVIFTKDNKEQHIVGSGFYPPVP